MRVKTGDGSDRLRHRRMNRRVGYKVDGLLQRVWLYRNGLSPEAELDPTGLPRHPLRARDPRARARSAVQRKPRVPGGDGLPGECASGRGYRGWHRGAADRLRCLRVRGSRTRRQVPETGDSLADSPIPPRAWAVRRQDSRPHDRPLDGERASLVLRLGHVARHHMLTAIPLALSMSMAQVPLAQAATSWERSSARHLQTRPRITESSILARRTTRAI